MGRCQVILPAPRGRFEENRSDGLPGTMYTAMYIKTHGSRRMGRMVRKQLYIEPEQDELLKRLSKELGVTEAELMRRALDSLVEPGEEDARQRALQELFAFMRARAKMKVPQTGRAWTRDELYDERLDRISH